MEYIRMVLMRENVSNSLAMIQPSLLEYTSERDDPEAVLCDISSMKDDVVILFDSYFNAVIWHGRCIKEWRDAEYHLDPEYAGLKNALELPQEHSKCLLEERFPAPRLISCDEGHGDERFIKSKLNPGDGNNLMLFCLLGEQLCMTNNQGKNSTLEGGNFIYFSTN